MRMSSPPTFGLSAVFRHVPEVYAALKIVGALYLVWLGVDMLRAKASIASRRAPITPKTAKRAFFESIVGRASQSRRWRSSSSPSCRSSWIRPPAFRSGCSSSSWASIVNFAFTSADIDDGVGGLGRRGDWRADGAAHEAVPRGAAARILIGLGAKLAPTTKGPFMKLSSCAELNRGTRRAPRRRPRHRRRESGEQRLVIAKAVSPSDPSAPTSLTERSAAAKSGTGGDRGEASIS